MLCQKEKYLMLYTLRANFQAYFSHQKLSCRQLQNPLSALCLVEFYSLGLCGFCFCFFLLSFGESHEI